MIEKQGEKDEKANEKFLKLLLPFHVPRLTVLSELSHRLGGRRKKLKKMRGEELLGGEKRVREKQKVNFVYKKCFADFGVIA